jgi:hypothetical protein
VYDQEGSQIDDWGDPYQATYSYMGTVEDLFDQIDGFLQAESNNSTWYVYPEYDPQRGFPVKICSGYEDVADSPGCTVISDFQVLP